MGVLDTLQASSDAGVSILNIGVCILSIGVSTVVNVLSAGVQVKHARPQGVCILNTGVSSI